MMVCSGDAPYEDTHSLDAEAVSAYLAGSKQPRNPVPCYLTLPLHLERMGVPLGFLRPRASMD